MPTPASNPRHHKHGIDRSLRNRLRQAFFIAIFLAIVGAPPTVAKAESSVRAVLIINDSAPTSPFAHRFVQQIHSTIDRATTQPYAIYPEYLDFGHFTGTEYDTALSAFLTQKYRNKSLSVIVALGSEALKFASRLRSQTWPTIPIVFVAFDGASIKRSPIPSNATGMIISRKLQDLLKLTKRLFPGLSTIVLVGESLEHQPLREQYQDQLPQIAQEFNVVNLTGRLLDDVKKRISTLSNDAAIFYIPLYTDAGGTSHNPAEALRAIAELVNRPIFIDSDDLIGTGAVGGFVPSAAKIGDETGQILVRILNGENPSAIPITEEDFGVPVFDSRQLKRWQIGEADLPVGSQIRFRELDVWDQYRWQMAAIFIVIAIQGMGISWLFYERSRRHIAERETHQHLLEVTKMDRAMTASAISASIAHELNQPLSAILNNAEAAELLLQTKELDRNQINEILTDIRRDDQRAVDIIKHLRMLLKQSELVPQDVDLKEVLADTLAIIRPHAAERNVVVRAEPPPASLFVRADPIHIQQVLLNLAMNAIDAMANTPVAERLLRVRINREDAEAAVSLEDAGIGIPTDKLESIFEPFVTTKQQGTGLGLSIARTIINTYGGRLWAENGSKHGAIFHFTLPLSRA